MATNKIKPNNKKPLLDDDPQQTLNKLLATVNSNEQDTKKLRQLVHRLDNEQALQQLHCTSLRQCLKQHLTDKKSISHLYREARAAKVETVISPMSTVGEIPESVLREIGKLENEKDQQRAWKRGQKQAGDEHPTASVIRAVVKEMVINGAPLSDPRAKKVFTVDPRESVDKMLRKALAQIDTFIAQQKPKHQRRLAKHKRNLLIRYIRQQETTALQPAP